jgi:hypothetical protein
LRGSCRFNGLFAPFETLRRLIEHDPNQPHP